MKQKVLCVLELAREAAKVGFFAKEAKNGSNNVVRSDLHLGLSI